MFKLFHPDSAFSRGMNMVWDLVVLNVLWLVCALPIVTAGAATAALYDVLFKMREDRAARVGRQFFAAFARNWKRATGTWLMILAAAALCGLDLLLVWQAENTLGAAFKVISVGGLSFLAMMCTFLFPLLARYENTWRNQLKNAALLAVANLPRLLLCWLFWGAAIALTLWSAQTLYAMLLIWLLVGFSSLSRLNLRILAPVFARLEQDAE